MIYNDYQQPIGEPVDFSRPVQFPQLKQLVGKTVTLEKLSLKHSEDLFEVYGPSSPAQNWTYLPIERFENMETFLDYFQSMLVSTDPYYLAIIDKMSGKAVGTFSFMRIDQPNRSLEMGWVVYASDLQRTRQATEAQYLAMKYVFEDLNYRRYEWKCDHFNAPSRQSALRLGFTYEGTFRKAAIYKGRTRDTDWFSILDEEWPSLRSKLEKWLDDTNFDAEGRQKVSLRQIL